MHIFASIYKVTLFYTYVSSILMTIIQENNLNVIFCKRLEGGTNIILLQWYINSSISTKCRKLNFIESIIK